MRPRILRLVVALATLVVVWLTALTARAASAAAQAPICDPRGAITFASPPQRQDPEQSLDITWNDDDCTRSPLETRHVVPDRAPPPSAVSPGPDATMPAAEVAVPGADRERLPAPDARENRSRPGFRTSLERPPRA